MKLSKYVKITKTKIPGIIKKLTGVSEAKFESILEKLTIVFREHEEQRLLKEDRERAVGGGRKPDLDLDDRLLMLLMNHYLLLGHEFLGSLFGIHNSNVSRQINYIEPMLEDIYEIPDRKIKLVDWVLKEEQVLKLFVYIDGDAGSETISLDEDFGMKIEYCTFDFPGSLKIEINSLNIKVKGVLKNKDVLI